MAYTLSFVWKFFMLELFPLLWGSIRIIGGIYYNKRYTTWNHFKQMISIHDEVRNIVRVLKTGNFFSERRSIKKSVIPKMHHLYTHMETICTRLKRRVHTVILNEYVGFRAGSDEIVFCRWRFLSSPNQTATNSEISVMLWSRDTERYYEAADKFSREQRQLMSSPRPRRGGPLSSWE